MKFKNIYAPDNPPNPLILISPKHEPLHYFQCNKFVSTDQDLKSIDAAVKPILSPSG